MHAPRTPTRRTRARARRATLRTSSTSHGASGPKHPPSTTTSTSNRFTAERERRCRGSGRPRRGSRSTACVTGLGAPHELRRDAARAAAGAHRDARPAGRSPPARRTSRGSRSSRTCTAGRPGSTVMWPNSPPNPWAPRKSSPSTKMPPPTPTSPKTQTKFSSIARDALPVLGERGEVRLVLGAHGSRARQPGGDLVGDGDLRPAEVRRPEQRAGLRLDDARAARRRRPPATSSQRRDTAASASVAIRPSRFSTGRGDERRLSVCTRRS